LKKNSPNLKPSNLTEIFFVKFKGSQQNNLRPFKTRINFLFLDGDKKNFSIIYQS